MRSKTKLIKFATRILSKDDLVYNIVNILFFSEINYRSHTQDLKNIIGVGLNDIIFNSDGNKIEVFFLENDLKKIKKPIINYIATKQFESHFKKAERVVVRMKEEALKRNAKKVADLLAKKTKLYAAFYAIVSFVAKFWYKDLSPSQKNKFIKTGNRFRTLMDDINISVNKTAIEYLRKKNVFNIESKKWMQKGFVFSKGRFLKKDFGKFLREKNFEYRKEKNLIKNENIIQGVIAHKGIARGMVKITLGPKDFKKVKKGDILVTTMTKPAFVPVFSKIKAIITDEGGILSHAAIISRELNIPCIIGAKIATHVLKDGDWVEVNANKGVVLILKRDRK